MRALARIFHAISVSKGLNPIDTYSLFSSRVATSGATAASSSSAAFYFHGSLISTAVPSADSETTTCSVTVKICILCAVTSSESIAILGAITKATTDINFKRIFNDGPEVSLKGSPTVSPTTAALCASVPFLPCFFYHFFSIIPGPSGI